VLVFCGLKNIQQSINYHDSCAHNLERHGPFTPLVGFKSSWFGSWYVAGANHVCMVICLATGGMPVNVGQFWLHV
jgi:hypothetical protein